MTDDMSFRELTVTRLAKLVLSRKPLPSDAATKEWTALWEHTQNKQTSDAVYISSQLLQLGLGVTQDEFKGRTLLAKAADAGNLLAIQQMVLQATNPADKVAWLLSASTKGDIEARYELAKCYLKGRGVPKDETRALALMLSAAEASNAKAMRRMGDFLKKGCEWSAAHEWYEGAIAGGNSAAAVALEALAFEGHAKEKYNPTMVHHVITAATKGYVPAILRLASLYKHGSQFFLRDYDCTRKWLLKAVALGSARARAEIGYLHEYGCGTPTSIVKAVEEYEFAASRNDSKGQYYLGNVYYYGKEPVDRNLSSAFMWFEKAAAQGEADAYFMLGKMYMEGKHVTKDVNKGENCWKEVLKINPQHRDAKVFLKNFYSEQMALL